MTPQIAVLDDEQMRTMIDNAVREEIYLREGLSLGLDRNDEIVRRRVAHRRRRQQLAQHLRRFLQDGVGRRDRGGAQRRERDLRGHG